MAGSCAVDGCDCPVLARGWCRRHYRRWLNHGDPMADLRLTVPWLATPTAEGHTFDPADERHGTTNGYSNHKCRCPACQSAWADAYTGMKENRAARLALDPSVVEHGLPSTYGNWRCRCRACTDAYSAQCLARKRRRGDAGASSVPTTEAGQ
jgi:hypothetical protein